MLTDEQRKLVVTYHFIIDETLKAMNLDYDEWYDVAAIGLCEAVERGIEDTMSIRDAVINAVVSEIMAIEHSDDVYDAMEKSDKILL